ncbi:MAG: pyridoxal 5'-phosphate synthase glutaminase subunit PdxT [Actinobacteria bacterium]|nr:pyridoxal 5'-phosphate synthase glutaminase subunit PdxT [Actinomycetota bacterium]
MGVLALQGDFREHIAALVKLGETALEIRTVEQLEQVAALIIPGGESTTISFLAKSTGLDLAIAERIKSGMAIYGSCAGMILLANEILDGRDDQISFNAIDITVRRNGFGRQVDSFEAKLKSTLFADLMGVFIRAPKIEKIGANVEVLAWVEIQGEQTPVMVRSGSALVTCFHPELNDDGVVHKYFVDMVHNQQS